MLKYKILYLFFNKFDILKISEQSGRMHMMEIGDECIDNEPQRTDPLRGSSLTNAN